MLIVVQFPAADLRPFLSPRVQQRMQNPDFRNLDPGADFLDHFGHARARVQRGVPDIPGEDTYFEIRRALRVPALEHRRWGSTKDPMYPFGAFRRFIVNDRDIPACVQMQVGFRHGRRNHPLRGLAARDCIRLLTDCLGTEALVFSKGYVPQGEGRGGERENLKSTELSQAGRLLAPLYEWATTQPKVRASERFDPRRVLPGNAAVFLEYKAGELSSLPASARELSLPQASGSSDPPAPGPGPDHPAPHQLFLHGLRLHRRRGGEAGDGAA